MKSLLIRTGSVPVQWDANRRRDLVAPTTVAIRRALSESHVIRSDTKISTGLSIGSRSSPALVSDESETTDRWRLSGIGIPVEEIEFSGGGIGKGRKTGGTGGGESDRSKVGEYYREMLISNPNDSLLLRNYGKFLHEVEGDVIKAEEYYGRAILASPGDGEVLSLYGGLIWETHGDEGRAKSYFDLAVNASPNDCTVLGSYARFMWGAEDEEEEEETREVSNSAMVEAF